MYQPKPAEITDPAKERKEKTKTAARTGMQKRKCLDMSAVCFLEGARGLVVEAGVEEAGKVVTEVEKDGDGEPSETERGRGGRGWQGLAALRPA